MSTLLSLFSLEGKTALVTGASRGLGRAIALGLAEAGADVAVLARTTSALEDTAAQVEKFGQRGLVLTCDAGDGEQVHRVVGQALSAFGTVDIVVNCAGGVEVVGPFLSQPFSDWAAAIRVNFESMVHVLQAIGPHLVERGGGSVINVSSVAGFAGFPMGSAYAVTKAAAISLTRSLAVEWAPAGVRVNALTPGWVKSQLTRNFTASEDVSAALMRAVPAGRWGDPEDIVGGALYLASDASRLVTGSCITVDGGMSSSVGGSGLSDLLALGRIPT
ncbi:glucose 1-dehydrogenase [Streptomyces sp. NPDC005065]|uniref:SDR family NAD(P)-dependent oxidoreductase n=1 Tax=unclassified Streptomyces TaxID=2593676 RepID=UPI0033BD8D8F